MMEPEEIPFPILVIKTKTLDIEGEGVLRKK
jgi:hypothetical protein